MKAIKGKSRAEKNIDPSELSEYKRIDRLLRKHSRIENDNHFNNENRVLKNLKNLDGF